MLWAPFRCPVDINEFKALFKHNIRDSVVKPLVWFAVGVPKWSLQGRRIIQIIKTWSYWGFEKTGLVKRGWNEMVPSIPNH